MFIRNFLRRTSLGFLASAAILGPLPALATSATLTFIDRSGNPLPGVIVLVDDGSEPVPKAAEMVQKHRAFQPNILTIAKGSPVYFPNQDNTQHHVFSFSAPKPFNIELYADQPEAPIAFETAGIVELGCNIHDQMKGFIVVADTGRIARSGAGGISQFDVQTLGPDGELHLKFWHPRLKDNTVALHMTLPGPLPIQQILTLDVMPEAAPAQNGLESLQKRFREL
ncbi:MAG: methylamine utilization protein [Marinobacter sp.]|uniref:methylamine utilization protein n=1 Tax=Marinobacter sp. TaxID=50741 RepID=UPI0034A08E07